jgi:hypothetical protein
MYLVYLSLIVWQQAIQSSWNFAVVDKWGCDVLTSQMMAQKMGQN